MAAITLSRAWPAPTPIALLHAEKNAHQERFLFAQHITAIVRLCASAAR